MSDPAFPVLLWTGAFPDEIAGLPEGTIVLNAPRPLLGNKCWEGPFRHGMFYAAVYPEEAQDVLYPKEREFMLNEALSSQAWRIRFVQPDEWRAMVMQYAERMATKYSYIKLADFTFEQLEESFRQAIIAGRERID